MTDVQCIPQGAVNCIKNSRNMGKQHVTIAIPSMPGNDCLQEILNTEFVTSVILPYECQIELAESARLGKFSQDKNKWILPKQIGNVLMFLGMANHFGVRMISMAFTRGVYTFIYQDGNGNWTSANTIILLIKKLFLSILSKIARMIAQTGFLLVSSRLVLNFLSRLPGNQRSIKILWAVNLKVNYQADNSTTPKIFQNNYQDLKLRKRKKNIKIKVVQYIGSLSPGGAERQLCNLISGIDKQKFEIRVLTYMKLYSAYAHYEKLLKSFSVEPEWVGSVIGTKAKRQLLNNRKIMTLLDSLPDMFSTGAKELLVALLEDPPIILHSWLDQSNICAAIAGLIADVPVIILSTRNVNPNHFPYLANPLYEPWYRMLYSTGQVVFINNSVPGAEDYSRWLGIPRQEIDVVHNGVDFSTIVKSQQKNVDSFRQFHGVGKNGKIIAGIFRLSEEKQPLVFINVCIKAMSMIQDIHVIIAGIGPLEEEMKTLVRESGFDKQFTFLGRYKDIPLLLSSSDVLLHTSRFEGTPNAVLEAQWLECPVIATRAGGTINAVKHQVTGLLIDVYDETGLRNSLIELLANDPVRIRLGQAGPEFINEQFNLHKMVNHTVNIYSRESEKFASKHIV